MDLSSDFDKAARRVKMFTDVIAGHGFDHRVSNAFLAKIVQRMLNEPPAQTLAAGLRGDGQIRDARLASDPIHLRSDIADDLTVGFGDKRAAGMGSHVVFYVPCFSPAPVT